MLNGLLQQTFLLSEFGLQFVKNAYKDVTEIKGIPRIYTLQNLFQWEPMHLQTS